MAIVNIGTESINFSDRAPVRFPAVPLVPGNGYIFIFQTVPFTQVVDFGYFQVLPYITVQGVDTELSFNVKWFPRGTRFATVVPVPFANTQTLNLSLALRPIEIFRGRSIPPAVTVRLAYEDALLQPVAFGL